MGKVIIRTINKQNLIPNSQRTHEELSEMGRKGGKASGVTRRRQAEQRELFTAMLDLIAEQEDEARTKSEK